MKNFNPSTFFLIIAPSIYITYIGVLDEMIYPITLTFSSDILPDNLGLSFWKVPIYTSLSTSVNSKCKLCHFTVRNRNNSNSTPRDVIFSAMFIKSYNLIPSIRSIRSTMSSCSIIIFTDSYLYDSINPDLAEFFNNCGCFLINIGTLPFSDRNNLFMMRNYVTYQFLQVNSHLFDRIIIIDLYDTIFQGDPFISTFPTDTIGVSTETLKIQGRHLEGAKILLGDKLAMSNCDHRQIVNCGTILGGTKVMLQFLQQFITMANRLNKNDYAALVRTRFPDQAIVNSLICGNILTEIHIKYRLYNASDEYITIYKLFRNRYLDFSLGNFIYQSEEYPLLIHLFDRSRQFCKSVLDSCPPIFEIPKTYNYIRCMNTHR